MISTIDFYFTTTFYYNWGIKKYACDSVLYLKKNPNSPLLSSLLLSPNTKVYGQNLIPEWGVDLGGEYRQATLSFVAGTLKEVESIACENMKKVILSLKDVIDKNKIQYCIFTPQTIQVKVEVI